MSATVQHLALNCRDRFAQETFYTRHFGFRRARVIMPGQPGEFVMLRLGSLCLELFGAPGQPADQGGGEQPVGFKHLAFEVADMESTLAGLRADGVVPDRVIDAGENVPGMRICFFRDPEGNILELMQGWHDEVFPS